jgi:hypothetical protein
LPIASSPFVHFSPNAIPEGKRQTMRRKVHRMPFPSGATAQQMATRGLVAKHPDDGQRFGPEHVLAVSVIPPIAAAALCIKPIAMPIEHRREGPSVKKCIGRRHARRTSDAQGRFMSGREPSSSGPRKVELMPLAPRLLLDTIWGPCSWRVWFRVGSPWRIGTPFPLSTLAWLMATRVHVENLGGCFQLGRHRCTVGS